MSAPNMRDHVPSPFGEAPSGASLKWWALGLNVDGSRGEVIGPYYTSDAAERVAITMARYGRLINTRRTYGYASGELGALSALRLVVG